MTLVLQHRLDTWDTWVVTAGNPGQGGRWRLHGLGGSSHEGVGCTLAMTGENAGKPRLVKGATTTEETKLV